MKRPARWLLVCAGAILAMLASACVPAANPVPPTPDVVDIDTGAGHNCAVLSDGAVECWGWNQYGQLGDGTNDDSFTAVSVSSLTGATAVAGGAYHTCALVTDGAVKCWGNGSWAGQLGNGDDVDSNVPVDVVGMTGATALSSSSGHTCALVAGGAVKCWGNGTSGQLGNGASANSNVPVDVVGVSGAIAVAAGAAHSCALLGTGGVKCWGSNSFGQLSGGGGGSNLPVDVIGISGATALEAGTHHACAVVAGGAVKRWGWNSGGQIGDGSTATPLVPLQVVGLTNAAHVALGYQYSCAELTDDTAKCWGHNTSGQLGIGSYGGTNVPPTAVTGLTGIDKLSGGESHACALVSDGSVKCWGNNASGQLGNGTDLNTNSPTTVIGLT